jgi:hypothetical protein
MDTFVQDVIHEFDNSTNLFKFVDDLPVQGLFWRGKRIKIGDKYVWKEPGHAKLAFRGYYRYMANHYYKKLTGRDMYSVYGLENQFWKEFWAAGICEIRAV